MAKKSKSIPKKVVKHLKEDIEMFKHEADEDRKLIKKIRKSKPKAKRLIIKKKPKKKGKK